jgi:hypothetical protein
MDCPQVFLEMESLGQNYSQNLTAGLAPDCVANGSIHLRVNLVSSIFAPCGVVEQLMTSLTTVSCFHGVNGSIDDRDNFDIVMQCMVPPTYNLRISPSGSGMGIWFNETVPSDFREIVVTVVSPQNTTFSSAYVSLAVTANSTIDTWWYSLNGGANISFSPNITLTAASGLNSLAVYANDTFGNTGSATAVFTTVEPVPPVVPPMTAVLRSTGSGLGGFLTAITSPLQSFLLAIGVISVFLVIFYIFGSGIFGAFSGAHQHVRD